MTTFLNPARHVLNRCRKYIAVHQQKVLCERFLPKRALTSIISTNRVALNAIDTWIDDDVYANSFFQYGIPNDILPLINLSQGLEPTYADAMLYLSRNIRNTVNYLEIGVSVGKTFWQMLNGLRDSNLTGFDIEEISPRLRERLDTCGETTWTTPEASVRKALSRDMRFTYSTNRNAVRYLAADIFDEQAWARLSGGAFNVIFSDAFHSADALRHEWSMLSKFNLIDPNGFVMVWDDLSGPMLDAFENITTSAKDRWGNSLTQCVIPLRGWLGINWGYHNVGFLVRQ